MNIKILSDERKIKTHWEDAIADSDLPEGLNNTDFFQDEFEDVILAQGIIDLDHYNSAKRIGRKGRLPRPQRAAVWQVMMRFSELCEADNEMTYPMMVAKAADYLSLHKPLPYKSLVIDESQDLTGNDWRFIRSLVPEGENDIFLVGDAHQRIYGKPVTLSRCGVNVRGRSRKLRINYRTTQEIRKWACQILEGKDFDDLDGEGDSHDGYTSLLHGPKPSIESCSSMGQQLDHAATYIKTLLNASPPLKDHAICCTVNDRPMRNLVAQGLRERGLDICALDQYVPADTEPGVRIGTMHRVKGLEFSHMILFNVEINLNNTKQLCLYHVAATRARDGLLVLLDQK